MMKNLSLILICLIPFLNLKAQDSQESFRLGFNAVFDKNLSAEKIATQPYMGLSTDYDKINYRIGFNLEYILNSNFSLFTAVQYSNKDFSGNYYCEVCNYVPVGPEDFELRIIETPIYVRYYFLPDKLKLFGEAGINNQFIISDFGNKNYSLAIKVGAGLEYALNSSLALQFLMDYNKGITKVFEKSDFKLDYLGFGVGIMKKI